jgi:hypothetical protein
MIYRDHILTKSQLILSHVCENTTAEEMFFEVGDFVTQLEGKPVKSLAHFCLLLKREWPKSKKTISIQMSSGFIGFFDKKNIKNPENYFKPQLLGKDLKNHPTSSDDPIAEKEQ